MNRLEMPKSISSFDIARGANRRIWDFVHQRANLNLRPGTGHYSTPFRGGLFGEVKATEVAKQLSTRRVDILWLGANPCLPRSLKNIITPPADAGDFPNFERQIESGFFGSLKWASNGTTRPDFNPIERPVGNWKIYQDFLKQIVSLQCVVMANFIPWGSANMKGFITQLGTANPSLLQRVIEFTDHLNIEIVAALRPKLIVIPLSLGRSRTLNAGGKVGVSLAKAIDVRSWSVLLSEGRFTFYTGICDRGKLTVPAVFLRHPASLRLSKESKKRLSRELAQSLQTLL
jgi:hypothetical protein